MDVNGEVETYDGFRGGLAPLKFRIGHEWHEVIKILNSRIEETFGLEGLYRQWWDIIDQDGVRYSLTHYRESDFWEIKKNNPIAPSSET